MHGTFERSGESDKAIRRSWGFGFLALPALLVIALVGLAITQPDMSSLVSEAVQAEFANAYLAPAIAPTQIAQPARVIRTVRAN
jgi:hypothetical protein